MSQFPKYPRFQGCLKKGEINWCLVLLVFKKDKLLYGVLIHYEFARGKSKSVILDILECNYFSFFKERLNLIMGT